MQLKTRGCEGATIAEVTIAVALSLLCLGSVFAMNTSAMSTLRMARESAWANQVLQQRIESLRIANWQLITRPDCTWLKSRGFMSDATSINGTSVPDGIPDPDGSELLKDEKETLTLEPYGSTTSGKVILSRTKGQAATIDRNDPGSPLLKENALKVIWTVNYKGVPNDRPLMRQTVAIIAKGGVAK